LDLSRIKSKIAEAEFFLGKMTLQEQRLIGPREPFDYYLSAFLSAGRTVDCRLRHEHKSLYKPWRKAWNTRLTPKEDSLIKFMVDDRNLEVHEGGSRRTVGQESVVLPSGRYRTPDGIFTTDELPGVSPNVIFRPSYSFTIHGANHTVTEACRNYLALLRRMVVDFETDNP
jgi:hypothetical protein